MSQRSAPPHSVGRKPESRSLPPAQDLSYLDTARPRATFRCAWRHYFASLVIYGVLWAVLRLNPWFHNLLTVSIGSFPAWRCYDYYLLAYAVIGPVIFFGFRPRSLWNSKNVLILGWLERVVRHVFGQSPPRAIRPWVPTFKEKHAFVFLLIKLVYGPLMLNSAFIEFNLYPALLQQWAQSPSLISMSDSGYGLFVTSVFFLDSVLFGFGYHTESFALKNQVRYVETSLLGLLVCVACYPPFNNVTTAFFGPSNDEASILFRGELHHPLTWVLRGLAVLALLLLTSSSLSLFTKASNLTNRGIVRHGPYAIIRHPGYVGKNLFWLATLIPLFFAVDTHDAGFSWTQHLLFCGAVLGGFIAWCSIYTMRALTEEKLLLNDPDYVDYCQKVKYRFIPGLC